MIEVIAWLLTGTTLLPLLILTAETLAGLRTPERVPDSAPSPRTTVIIPAHDEAAGIAATVAAVVPSGCDILVVADNCTDATAAVARAAGARVLERHDPQARGKGHALAFARAALEDDPPAVVIILDADCHPVDDALVTLARHVAHTGRATQGRNELETRVDASPMIRISNFAFSLKNVVRQRGLMRIAGTCVLTGTGMAFPWARFQNAPLATADSVEDLAIGLALIRARQLPIYAEHAQVRSPAASGAAAVTQRTRWEHGFIATALRVAPGMVAHGVATLHWPSLWLGLHLIVPPLALTFGLATAVLMVVAAMGFASSFVPAMILAATIAVAGLAIVAGWRVVGRGILPLATLLRVPLYIAWKLPIYLRLTRGADRRWTRTERD